MSIWSKYTSRTPTPSPWAKYATKPGTTQPTTQPQPIAPTQTTTTPIAPKPVIPGLPPSLSYPTAPVVTTKTTPMWSYPAGVPTIELVDPKAQALVLGQSLKMLPRQLAATVLQATQGETGASVVNKDWADIYVAQANEDMNRFVEGIRLKYPLSRTLQETAQLSQNLAYSLTSMGAGTVSALPLWLVPEPTGTTKLAAATVTGAVAGFVSYRMTTYQIVQQYLEFKNQEKIEQTGQGLTLEEENQLKTDFHSKAVKYGLWEAIPEGISNMLFSGILTGAFTNALVKVAGKEAAMAISSSLGARITSKAVGIYGEEFLTETITQKGQSAIEVEAGLREDKITWWQAFKEIAPQTFLLTTIMAGAGQTIVSSSDAIKKITTSLKSEIGEKNPLYDTIIQGITEGTEGFETEAPTTAMAEWETTTGELGGKVTLTESPYEEGLYAINVEGTEGSVGGIKVFPQKDTLFVNRISIHEKGALTRSMLGQLDALLIDMAQSQGKASVSIAARPENMHLFQSAGYIQKGDTNVLTKVVTPEYAPTTAMAAGETVSGNIDEMEGAIASAEAIPAAEAGMPTGGIVPPTTPIAIEGGAPPLSIPPDLSTTPPPITPQGAALGRTDNDFTGIMADLQDAEVVADVEFQNDMLQKWARNLPTIQRLFKVINPKTTANTPAEKATIIRAILIDESSQKTQGVISYVLQGGSQQKVFGVTDSYGRIKSGLLKGQTLGDIAQTRSKWESKLTDEQKLWLDRAKVVEESAFKFLEGRGFEPHKLRLEDGGQFATRRVWAKTLSDGTIIEVAFVGAKPGRIGAKLPTEKHRIFKTEAEAIEAGYQYVPYEEALYLKVLGAYIKDADQRAIDWLLTKVPWRTTGAPEELILAAEAARVKLRHSQMLLAALNRAVRGERVPDVTIRAIGTSYPNQAQELKDLIPRLQAGKPTAKEVQNLTNVAKGLIDTNKMESLKAVNARARARELAMTTRFEEAAIPAPAFSGKILTGPDAKETARVLRESFDPTFSNTLGAINKLNAVARYYMLAGDFSLFQIQLIFMMGENPKVFSKAFAGSIRAMFDPKFHASQLAQFKDVIDRHPNMILSIRGRTEFTEAMARGGWLSGDINLFPEGEAYRKKVALFFPRVIAKGAGKFLTPFQREFECGLDLAGIYKALADEHLVKNMEDMAELDHHINEFRGLYSSASAGISVHQRQAETVAMLAPRYFRGVMAWLWSQTRGGLRGKLARRSFARGLTALVIMGILISLLRKEEPEEILDHFNPNSSNFFTWEIAGQKVGPGSKVRSLLKLFAQSAANPDELLEFSMDNPALRFARGNLSPAVSSGIDLITGRSYLGDPTRDGILSFTKEILAGNLLPVWIQSVLFEGGSPGGRSVRGVAEFFGWRSYPEPLYDEVGKLRDQYALQDFSMKWEKLNREQVDKVRENHPDLLELETKAELEAVERGSEFEKWFYNARQKAITDRNDALETAATLLLNGTYSKYQYDSDRGYARPYYSGGMGVLYSARESLDQDTVEDINKWLADNQKPEDKALDTYQEYRASLINTAELPRDWDDIEAKCGVYLAKLPKATRDYVNTNLNSWINDLPENAKKVELMRLQGIENETWWDDYRGTTTSGSRWPSYLNPASGTGSKWSEYLK